MRSCTDEDTLLACRRIPVRPCCCAALGAVVAAMICCVVAGDSGCEAYTAIAWGVGLSHERSDIAGAESLYSLEARVRRRAMAAGHIARPPIGIRSLRSGRRYSRSSAIRREMPPSHVRRAQATRG